MSIDVLAYLHRIRGAQTPAQLIEVSLEVARLPAGDHKAALQVAIRALEGDSGDAPIDPHRLMSYFERLHTAEGEEFRDLSRAIAELPQGAERSVLLATAGDIAARRSSQRTSTNSQ